VLYRRLAAHYRMLDTPRAEYRLLAAALHGCGSQAAGFLARQGCIVVLDPYFNELRVHILGRFINITAFGTPHVVFTPRSADFPVDVSTLGENNNPRYLEDLRLYLDKFVHAIPGIPRVQSMTPSILAKNRLYVFHGSLVNQIRLIGVVSAPYP
jgi:hypothetical protein